MNKKIVVLTLLVLTGCSITPDNDTENTSIDTATLSAEELTASPFILIAAQGYVNTDNYATPHTYLVDSYRNQVYVDKYEEPSGLTPEEIIENAEKEEAVESIHPIFEIDSLDVEGDSIRLQYDAELVEFTALSDSYYEDQKGVRYIIDSHEGIDDYIENFFE